MLKYQRILSNWKQLRDNAQELGVSPLENLNEQFEIAHTLEQFSAM